MKIKDIGKHLPRVSHDLVAKALGAEMNTYSFTIWFESLDDDDVIAEELYEAGCDDALCGVSYGKKNVSFDREAVSVNNAIRSAIDNIISSGLDIEIKLIEVH